MSYNQGKNHPFFGKHHTEESKEKMRKSWRGKTPWIKGYTPWNKGKTGIYSSETIEKIRLARDRQSSPNKGIRMSEQQKQKIRIARLNQIFPRKDTKPERILQSTLSIHGLTFETHKPILGQPDIFIEPNICVFVDGDYWHNLPNQIIRDVKVNEGLESNNYIVLRFWEHDVLNNINDCYKKIIECVGA